MAGSAERELRELANRQGGYFTARQAVGLGFVRNHYSYQVSKGDGGVCNRADGRLVSQSSNPAIGLNFRGTVLVELREQ